MVHKIDRKMLGHKNSIPLEPYLRWVRAHAQSLMMPYPAVLPVTLEPTIEGDTTSLGHHPNMPTDHEEL